MTCSPAFAAIRSLALAALAALLFVAPTVAQELDSWTIPNFEGERVSDVMTYWETHSNGEVHTVVAEGNGGPFGPPTRQQEGLTVEQNAQGSEPGGQVSAGGSVGVIVLPQEERSNLLLILLVAAVAVLVVAGLVARSRKAA